MQLKYFYTVSYLGICLTVGSVLHSSDEPGELLLYFFTQTAT